MSNFIKYSVECPACAKEFWLHVRADEDQAPQNCPFCASVLSVDLEDEEDN